MLTLRKLRYLSALAQHRHFSRAAEACAVSQPALSMQIKELEEFLGVELVERRSGEAVLTEIGAAVAQRAEHVLGAARDLEDFARHHSRPLTGRLRLGVIPTVAPYLLPRLLPALQAKHPGLRIDLRETQTRQLVAELSSGSLDAIMLAMPVPDPEIESVALFEDAFLLAVPASDPPLRHAPATPDDIDQQRLILLEEGHCLRDQALAFCGHARPDAALSFGATSLATVLQMVSNGYGITLVPNIAVDVEARDERVRLVRFADPEPGRTIGLAWRRTSARKADFLALAEIVRSVPGGRSARPATLAGARRWT
ncbi:MAG: hydrogen peroxide-inducible genes activator [Pseudorhodoplanes sp.]|nr:hydrogen peroxide-inducible genes activator [Pseudorhodoplanes sp.]